MRRVYCSAYQPAPIMYPREDASPAVLRPSSPILGTESYPMVGNSFFELMALWRDDKSSIKFSSSLDGVITIKGGEVRISRLEEGYLDIWFELQAQDDYYLWCSNYHGEADYVGF